jgi:hypothetical protein
MMISLLTSNLAIGVRIPARVEASRRSCEVHDWQSLALEIAPVQAVAARFVVGVVVVGAGGFDFGHVPFYADEADCCKNGKKKNRSVKTNKNRRLAHYFFQ